MDTQVKLLYLPLDERPCNDTFAAQIAKGTPVELIKPGKQLLGDKKTPAGFEGLKAFLLENAQADACVLSVDMLLYGGIVPSRLHQLTREELGQRLEVLRQLKQKNPKLKLFGFALIMRCPSYSSADEEPDYYETCGREIFLTGQCKHKLELGLMTEQEAQGELDQYAQKVGPYLQDFEQRRRRNRWVLEQLLTEYYDLFESFIIPQDDSAEFGYTTMDRTYLIQLQMQRGMTPVPMYPGADEVGMSLMSRAVCHLLGKTPQVYCQYAHEDAPKIYPLYEDRPVGKTLPVLLAASGCDLCEDPEQADIYLYLNYPAHDMVEAGQLPGSGYVIRHVEQFCASIAQRVRNGQVVALADNAFCNGGDVELLRHLASQCDLTQLSAYSGWNTSSNTLGTAVCQAVFVWLFGHSEYQQQFIAQRLYEDVGYCGAIRRQVTNMLAPMGYGYFDAGERDGIVAAMVRKQLQAYMDTNFPKLTERYILDRCQMPWKRMFEVDLTVQPRPFRLGTWHRPNETGMETDLAGIQAVLDTFVRTGIDLVFVETIYHGMATYKGGPLPYNDKLSQFDYAPYPDYMTAFTCEAEKRNIQVHAWVEVFYVGVEDNIFTEKYPSFLLRTKDGRIHHTEGAEYGGYLFLDPANGAVAQFLRRTYESMLLKFPSVRGLNLDYIRYPLSDREDDTGFTNAALDGFARGLDRQAQIEKTQQHYDDWVNFRAGKVTDFVAYIRQMLERMDRGVLLSTAVFPEQQKSFGDKKQDFSTWLAEGYLDVLTPMAYYDDPDQLSSALKDMLTERGKCICYAGISPTYHDLPWQQVYQQVQIARQTGCEGAVFFGSHTILNNPHYIQMLEDSKG